MGPPIGHGVSLQAAGTAGLAPPPKPYGPVNADGSQIPYSYPGFPLGNSCYNVPPSYPSAGTYGAGFGTGAFSSPPTFSPGYNKVANSPGGYALVADTFEYVDMGYGPTGRRKKFVCGG